MPPQFSLPLRDGRTGLPSSPPAAGHPSNNDGDYSDDDIRLLNEIVKLGESLLPTLPEEERLPTNALFSAADEVLPAYGYDADSPPNHISRLLFKIGGQRAGVTLSDKFRAVLAGMHIVVEEFEHGSSPESLAVSRGTASPSSNVARPESDQNKDLQESPLIIPNAPTHSHLPPIDGSEAGDTTAPSDDDDEYSPAPYDEPPAEETAALESLLEQSRMEQQNNLLDKVFYDWHDAAIHTHYRNGQYEARAAEYDDFDMAAEVLEMWVDLVIEIQEARQEAHAEAERNAYLDRMERRACRVYEIYTMRTTLSFWQDQARDEVDRTAVARRHLVRKRAFDGWRKQHVEDEAKVTNFILIHALQKWAQVSLYHEVRGQVAVRRHNTVLATRVLDTMWKEHKGRLADEFLYYRTLDDCWHTWFTRTQELSLEESVVDEMDERWLLQEALSIWQEETLDVQYTAHEGTILQITEDVSRVLADWQEQAKLTMLLRHCKALEEEDMQAQVLQTWRDAASLTRRAGDLAGIVFLFTPLDDWWNEAKLVRFQRQADEDVKSSVLGHWVRQERLAWFEQYSERNMKKKTLGHLLASAQESHTKRRGAQKDARLLRDHYTKLGAVDRWFDATEVMWRHSQNANLVCLYRTARPCLESWREYRTEVVTRHGIYRREAARYSASFTVSNVLDVWPRIAERVRRERLMVALRHFRRQYKIDLAESCLETWWSAAVDSTNASHDAYAIHVQHRRDDVIDYLGHWDAIAKTSQQIRAIAADAEAEVYYGAWQSHLADAQESALDAVDFDAAHVLVDCCRRWEFQALQVDGLRRTSAALRERNDNRLRRHALEAWHQTAQNPAAADAPPLISILRSQARRPPYPETPRPLPMSRLGFSARPGGTGTRLGPMVEFDVDDESLFPDGAEQEEPGFMSTPTRWRGSARPPHPVGSRYPATTATTTPSAILASPYERELRREYGVGGRGGRGWSLRISRRRGRRRRGEGGGWIWSVFSWMDGRGVGLASFLDWVDLFLFFSCLHWLLDIPWGFCNTALRGMHHCLYRKAYWGVGWNGVAFK
ncbi:Sfi1 spindle body protein-domain-containing protein [Schizothecium vesticola]|uniref:Sfi1 spindle body protein-domain-containing protein n=1 Tax=Schizothecium vesticola TaxID=314040 RepID=A0AA40EKK4_9PEZI|nr:Sfi1 spindle body protein-domain-containing protein [Schizothecium vesticola]